MGRRFKCGDKSGPTVDVRCHLDKGCGTAMKLLPGGAWVCPNCDAEPRK